MKIETLKTSKRKYFWGALVVGVVLLITLVLTTSKAKYQTTQSIPLVRGTINYRMADINILAINVQNDNGEYVSSDTIPTSGYKLNTTESYCTIPDGSGGTTKDTSITIEYSNGLVNFLGLSKKGTKCYLYFDALTPFTIQDILANKTISTRNDFSVTMTADTTGTIYSAEDDDGTSYYFAGAPTDNYVQFAGFYWRIIRINGDGTIRLIYDGTSAIANGTSSSDTQIGTSPFNSTQTNHMYVGYMYTSGSVHGLGTSSTIKGVLDTWYDSNLTSFASYIDSDAGFCNDRTPYSGTGTGTTTTYYGAYNRLYTNKVPSLKCASSSDLFTVSTSIKGNKALTNPIGLITADEIAYAGGVYETNNTSYYLYTGQEYWTLSPVFSTKVSAFVLYVNSAGGLDGDGSSSSDQLSYYRGVRPVINLKTGTLFTTGGEGTASNPYVVLTS